MANGKVLNHLIEIKGLVTEMKSELTTVCKTVENHDKLFMGEPERMGEGGVIATVAKHTNQIQGIGTNLNKYRQQDAARIHGINGIVNLIIAGVMNWAFSHMPHK